MTKDYIPSNEDEFFGWQNNLIDFLTPANATAWGIPEARITALQELQGTYGEAYAAANKGKKATRTAQQVQAKKDAQKTFVAEIRQFVKQFLAFNDAVSDNDRLALGLTVRDTVRTASGTPATIPDLFTTPMNGSRLKITVRQQPDENGSSRRGKPNDASQFEIAIWIGENAPLNGDNCSNKNRYSRSPVIVSLDGEEAGKPVTVYARWIGKKGQPGPWSNGENGVVTM